MDVSVLSHTPNPDRLVCATARGDYMEDSLVDVDLNNPDDYEEVMRDVVIDGNHVGETNESWDSQVQYRQTRSFIEELLQRGHFGPFEHAHITFAVEGISRACMAQLTRHRHTTFDVQSMRYVNFDDADVVTPESMEDETWVFGEERVELPYTELYEEEVNTVFDLYQEMTDAGVPEEDARMVLPIGTKVNLTMTINLRSLMHVLDMRHAGDAQHEIRELSEKLMNKAEKVAPITFEEYRDHAKGASKKAP